MAMYRFLIYLEASAAKPLPRPFLFFAFAMQNDFLIDVDTDRLWFVLNPLIFCAIFAPFL